MRNICRLIFRSETRALVLASLALSVLIHPFATAEQPQKILWEKIEPGYETGRYEISQSGAMLKSAVILARFNPEYFSFRPVLATDLGSTRSDIKQLVDATRGVAGINANFFDPNGRALGLVIIDGKNKNRIHLGGNTLTGIFAERRGALEIVHRSEFSSQSVNSAVQAGPRLIAGGKALPVESPSVSSRRSGVALTNSGDVILFATMLRFPGASLQEIQEMLLLPELAVVEALNFDGGGSSQLYLDRSKIALESIVISGGDLVPVGIVVTRKGKKL